ncbi:MAG: SRPBCC domain-containing protein [Proteobacteria bacterium]|nr:SRPBCC domain-containing protein [Pseudomonadota bacterium]
MTKWVFSTFLFLLSAIALADVTSKGDRGFSLVITGVVETTPNETYDQFVRIDEWWLEGHTWYGKAENLSLEPKAGGCFCEISGDNQVLHMLVTFVQPGIEIKMVGGLGPLQMMGIHGGMSWRFESIPGGTRITQTYNVTGYAPGGLTDLAEIVDSVQTSQLNALVNKLSSSND